MNNIDEAQSTVVSFLLLYFHLEKRILSSNAPLPVFVTHRLTAVFTIISLIFSLIYHQIYIQFQYQYFQRIC